jgi:hypothetical protein
MQRFYKSLPDGKSIAGVFAWAAFLSYGWTLVASFWKVPSWLYYLTIGELFSIYAYSFIVNFLESLSLLLLALVIGFVLPKRWWNDSFQIKGSLLAIVILGSVMVRLYMVRTPDEWEKFLYGQWPWWGYTLALYILLAFSFTCISWLRSGLEMVTERVVTFLYIYIPITLISLIVVIIRNV